MIYLTILPCKCIIFTVKTKMQAEENILADFLSKEKLTIRHVRCIIVGCSGAGKTTLLRRLQNAKFNDLKNVKTTELVEVHENIFDVSENENTIQSNNFNILIDEHNDCRGYFSSVAILVVKIPRFLHY